MCPVCLTTAAVIAGSATGTGGLTALIARKFLKRKSPLTLPAKENHDSHSYTRSASPEDGLTR